MRSKVTTAPASEPVTLTEVKSSLRITNSAEDTLLTQYIEDARIWAENYTGKKCITQTVTSYYDAQDAQRGNSNNQNQEEDWEGTRVGSIVTLFGQQSIELEFGPAISITSVETIDTDNSGTTFSSSNYYLDNFDDFQRPNMVINQGESLGSNELRARNSVKIVYVSGYGAASDVPSALRRAILLIVGELYSNRGDCSIGQCSDACGATRMLDQYKFFDV